MESSDVRDQWTGSKESRENLVYGIARYVSKRGDLDHSHSELTELATFLSAEEVVELYTAIRDQSGRLEDEWRDEFIEYFPESEDDLPEQFSMLEVKGQMDSEVATKPVEPTGVGRWLRWLGFK